MRLRSAKASLIMATVGVGAALCGTVGTVRANATHSKEQKPAAARIGWGEPQDGLQIGLFPQGEQKTYRYGDTLALVLRVRNVSPATVELTMKQPQISSVTLGENGRLTLQTLGAGSGTASLRLAPGETEELPNGRFAAQIAAPGEPIQQAESEVASPPLALLPGEYHVECNYPIWLQDKDDASRATAHRAKPGGFTFTVKARARETAKVNAPGLSAQGKNKAVSDVSIAWGETVNGLQGGLRRITAKDMLALPADKRKDLAEDEVSMQFFVRNVTDKPLALSYHNFDENDASYWVKDAGGKDYRVQTTFFTGMRAMRHAALQAGEQMQTGEGRMRFQTQNTPHAANDYTPLLTAEAGQYTLRLVSSVRFAGSDRFDMVLISGAVPFTVTP